MPTISAHQAAARIREALESPTRPSFDFPIKANPTDLRALLAERDELAKDAARYDALKHAPTELIRGLLTTAPGHWDGIADAILTNKD